MCRGRDERVAQIIFVIFLRWRICNKLLLPLYHQSKNFKDSVELSVGKNYVNCASLRPKSTLGVRMYAVYYIFINAVKDHSCKDFSSYAQQTHSPVISTYALLSLAYVQRLYRCIFELLRNIFSFPDQTYLFAQLTRCLPSYLKTSKRILSRPGALPLEIF